MEVGLLLPQAGNVAGRDSLLSFAQTAERLGFDSLWVVDHVAFARDQGSRYPYSPDGTLPVSATTPLMEPLATLAFVAAATSRVRLGTAVLVLPRRHPVLHAKWIATIDHLAGGRVILGVGSGWWKEEFELLDVPWDRRGRRLDESISLLRKLWTGDFVEHDGEFFKVDGWTCRPAPAQGQGVPIWVGGENERAVRRAGLLGDGYFAVQKPVPELVHQYEMAEDAALEAGRDPASLTRAMVNIYAPLTAATLEQSASDTERYAREAGVRHVVLVVLPDREAGYGPVLSGFAEKFLPALHAV
jgi:probable F420-dependent oxidoreductase